MCTNTRAIKSKSSVSSPLKDGQPETISTVYRKLPRYYEDEALDADFDAKDGKLTLKWAQDKEWDNAKSSKRLSYVDITVTNGLINSNPVNLDLANPRIKEIETPGHIASETEDLLRSHGFEYNSRTVLWEKGYKGFSKEGSTLYVDSALPDNFTGITKIKTKYGAVDTRIIKRAGFRWDPANTEWVKKS